MTPKSLFNIILKIFGLFFLREIIYIIPELISSISFLTSSNDLDREKFNGLDILPFISILISLAFYILIIYQLLFNTNKIIDKLKLDKGFNQDEFSFNISTSLMLTISLIVIGGVILINEIPDFISSAFSYFQEKNLTNDNVKTDYSYIIISGMKILFGLLIIGERKRIAGFIVKRQGKKEIKIESEI